MSKRKEMAQEKAKESKYANIKLNAVKGERQKERQQKVSERKSERGWSKRKTLKESKTEK